MEHKEQIALYLSGLADKRTRRKTEKALMRDAGFAESFVEVVEMRLHDVPPGFAASVMQRLPGTPSVVVKAPVKAPVLSRKFCAAVCFASAAAIMLLTVSGFDRHIADFILTQSGKFNEWLAFAQILSSGGN